MTLMKPVAGDSNDPFGTPIGPATTLVAINVAAMPGMPTKNCRLMRLRGGATQLLRRDRNRNRPRAVKPAAVKASGPGSGTVLIRRTLSISQYPSPEPWTEAIWIPMFLLAHASPGWTGGDLPNNQPA